MYTKESFLKELGEYKLPDAFAGNFESIAEDYYKNGVDFLSDDFINGIEAESGFFEIYEFVLESAKKVRESELASLYALCMYDLLKTSDTRVVVSQSPTAQDGETSELLAMASYFSLIAFAPEIRAWYKNAEVPEDVIDATMEGALRSPITVHLSRTGHYGFDPVRLYTWQQLYMRHELLRVGILNFQVRYDFVSYCMVFRNKKGETCTIIKDKDISKGGMLTGCKGHDDKAFFSTFTETDEYYEGYATDESTGRVIPTPVRLYKNEWEIALAPDSHTVSTHIPAGVTFTQENINAAYEEFLKIAKKSYPDFKPKAFICLSWLISPQLKDFLKPEANILGFQNKYNCKIPLSSQGLGVISFLFLLPGTETDYTKFPENTSLQRKIKEYYLSGGTVYEFGGAFLI